MTRTAAGVATALAAWAFGPGCDRKGSGPAADDVATVNGVPIHDADVALAARREAHRPEAGALAPRDALEAVVRQEVLAQRAAALGLDADPGLVRRLHAAEAQARAFRRRALADALFQKEVAATAKVTDLELRAFWDANVQRLRTEVHLWQIFRRGKDAIDKAKRDLDAGAAFEEVAGKGLPALPGDGPKPWDMGWQTWIQLPESWRDVAYALKPGETSGVVAGPKDRFWIVRLVESRGNAARTFESDKAALASILEARKALEVRENLEKDLRAKAKVVRLKEPGATDEEP